MTCRRLFTGLRASKSISWKQTGSLQKTLASTFEISGTALHSGALSTVKLFPAKAGEGRFFVRERTRIPASIDFVTETTLCTTLCREGTRVRTVEHLLSALEAVGVDNCRIEIVGADEVPILDGSSRKWVEAIEQVGLSVAKDHDGNSTYKMAPYLLEPIHVTKSDSFLVAFPSPKVYITYGINFPQVPVISSQWLSLASMDKSFYAEQIASSRTFCIYEEVERLLVAGLIQGGSAENAIVCSASKGWLNPPLRFDDEPCRHKVLDLVGDLSLFAQAGSQGVPVAHIVAYKVDPSLKCTKPIPFYYC
ncbi:PREDICTED: probable UDP-3-O-acyl-N-acetylglucosamine deacetylase 2 isoform X2 [Nelumbo nucifera]|uniref:UDP-3-O-acyl-N-acetylglucosamine deacetylase n=1 Tax=Nelumbo nucifera TaxID=4432 RepID=A0A1U8AWG7_NELNU|nr:PREDICTED: probable UDP-3-O-acyl-N-acetylglucosamine deacetylase 2 isoform X2 [Nelumbo nucifera]